MFTSSLWFSSKSCLNWRTQQVEQSDVKATAVSHRTAAPSSISADLSLSCSRFSQTECRPERCNYIVWLDYTGNKQAWSLCGDKIGLNRQRVLPTPFLNVMLILFPFVLDCWLSSVFISALVFETYLYILFTHTFEIKHSIIVCMLLNILPCSTCLLLATFISHLGDNNKRDSLGTCL